MDPLIEKALPKPVIISDNIFYCLKVSVTDIPETEDIIKITKTPGDLKDKERLYLSAYAWRALIDAIPRIEELNPALKAENQE